MLRFGCFSSRETGIDRATEQRKLSDDSNNNNVYPMDMLKLTMKDRPLLQETEIRTEVTQDLLKKILKQTRRAKLVDPTRELVMRGETKPMKQGIKSTRMVELGLSCPSLETLALQGLNLCALRRERRLGLQHFPANIERLSLRDSLLEPRSFLPETTDPVLSKLEVLDLGRARLVGSPVEILTSAWPKIESLKELYLEGALSRKSAPLVRILLRNFPALEVLDLERVPLTKDDLDAVATLAPHLRELYLGYTGITESCALQFASSGRGFEKLEVLCLCETSVRDHGFAALVELCPKLCSVTVKRSMVGIAAAEAASQGRPGLRISRVEMTHIFTVFPDIGCDHFASKHALCAKRAF